MRGARFVICNGRGFCGCGAERCAVAAWWHAFCSIWIGIGWSIAERMRDDMTEMMEDR